MTIGMFIESLAGKSGALHAIAQDSTPFQFDEQHTAVDHFGHQLVKAGYNYYGKTHGIHIYKTTLTLYAKF
jgi:DNA-directed RNA polymerase I subunit RPA2